MANNDRARPVVRGPLSPALIIEVAQSLVDNSGIESLTMRKIADVLGITPMALYRHVKNKNDLLVQLLDHSVAAMPQPELPSDPVQRVVVLVVWMHSGLSRHQWVVRLLAEGDLIAPSILWVLEEIYGALMGYGLDLPVAADVFRVVWRFVIGDLTERMGRQAARIAAERAPLQETVPAQADPQAYPHVAALNAYWRSRSVRDDFSYDLERLVRALLSNL